MYAVIEVFRDEDDHKIGQEDCASHQDLKEFADRLAQVLSEAAPGLEYYVVQLKEGLTECTECGRPVNLPDRLN